MNALRAPFRLAAIALAALALAVGAPGAQAIVVGGFPNVKPYAVVVREEGKPDRITGGLVVELFDEVARRTGLEFAYSFPPRKRMDLEIAEGRLDIVGMANPAWLAAPESMDWSPEVFGERMVFVSKAEFPRTIKGLAELGGLRVGMNTGYTYPEFGGALPFTRDDAATVPRNIERLSAGWIDVVYGGEFDVKSHLGSDASRYRIHPWSPASSTYQWAVAKRLGERGALVLRTIEAMVKDGTVARILAKYR
ncbi:MAG TPA: transporter substrate-binding domain-containing protein [Spirochaetales bacterium]|nr:transporter substrate-binding domain-containing protein [Spirochaetales bacterium]